MRSEDISQHKNQVAHLESIQSGIVILMHFQIRWTYMPGLTALGDEYLDEPGVGDRGEGHWQGQTMEG